MTTFFTSDLHLGHRNLIEKHKARPFASIKEHDQVVIQNWNLLVAPADTVYLLGDFALSSRAKIAEYRKKLMGRIILIAGNHDRSKTAMLALGFDEVYDSLLRSIDGLMVFMCHQPQAQWAGASYHLCGHVHKAWARRGDVINVGVDVRAWRPVTLAELLEAREVPT